MKVALFSHSSGFYGAERSLADLVVCMGAFGLEPLVVLPGQGQLGEVLGEHGIECVVSPYYGWLGRRQRLVKGAYRAGFNAFAVRRLSRMLAARGIAVVYTNTLASPVGALVARSMGLPHVWHLREFVHEDMGAEFDYGLSRAARVIATHSDYVIYNSQALKDKYGPIIRPSSEVVIHNGWLQAVHSGKNPKTLDRSPDELKLCIVGSVHRGKGQHEAIEALTALERRGRRASLTIVGLGDPAYMRELEQLSHDRGITSRVHFAGFRTDVSEIYRESDVALVCSRSEAFGRVVVEAMAEGCPVVASNSGGIPEIIQQGVNGLLYRQGEPEDLAEKVIYLAENVAEYNAISRNGLVDAFARFDVRRYSEQVSDVLLTVVTRARGERDRCP